MGDIHESFPSEASGGNEDYSHHTEAKLGDMVARGRTLLEKDRDDSSRFSARINAGKEPDSMSHKGITDFLRKPL